MNKLLLLLDLVVVSFFVIAGCSNSWQQEYSKQLYESTPKAMKLCSDYGQEYSHHYFNGSEWLVQCFQKSPYKIITKKLSGELT